jgi:bifunctional non-homologous end joining protein LigD
MPYGFHLLELDGQDLCARHCAKSAWRPVGKGRLGIVVVEQTAEGGARIFEQACATGFEGIVFKRQRAPYRSGRSPDWLKIRNPGTGLSGR